MDNGKTGHIILHGVPGDNFYYGSQGEARRAALRAMPRGGGYSLAHDPSPSRGQPHYHLVDANGQRVSGHFFYGSRVPRKEPWGPRNPRPRAGQALVPKHAAAGTRRRRQRELEAEGELDQTLQQLKWTTANSADPNYIRWIQRSLNLLMKTGLVVDGVRGPKTISVIKMFQQRAGLKVDGIVGPKTEFELAAAVRRTWDRGVPSAPVAPSCPIGSEQEIAWEQAHPAGMIQVSNIQGLTTITLWNFAVGSHDPKPEHMRELRRIGPALAAAMRNNPTIFIEIEGHGSCSGSGERNDSISKGRAESVRTALIRAGVPAGQLIAEGLGESNPAVPNTTPENMAMNRRVVLRGAAAA